MMPRFSTIALTASHDDLPEDVRRGLCASPKELPAKYLYDAAGSDLFDQICELPEYYPTRVETSILEHQAQALLDSCPGEIDLVDVAAPLGRAGGPGPGAEGRNVDHFALQVSPFDEAAIRAHLEAHGVEVGEVAQRYGAEGSGPSLYIRDPDGNVVELKGV